MVVARTYLENVPAWSEVFCLERSLCVSQLSCIPLSVDSGVARIWCEEGHDTKRKEFKLDTQKYYEIHAINSDKAIGLYTFPG